MRAAAAPPASSWRSTDRWRADRRRRLGYQILAGQHVRDPWSMPVPLDLPDPAGPDPRGAGGRASGGKTHPDVAAGVRKAGKALADAGYQVEEIEPPQLAEAFDIGLTSSAASSTWGWTTSSR